MDGKGALMNIGFMQGRMSDPLAGRIQAFPWNTWENEFSTAQLNHFSLMEWTLDYEGLRENPLMTDVGRLKIRTLSHKYGISIPSLTGDCFMQFPFWKTYGAAREILFADFKDIVFACSQVGIRMVIIPLVDNGRLDNQDQEDILIDYLFGQQDFLSKNCLKVIFESDFAPDHFRRFIDRLPDSEFGINYDIGNSAALGFDPQEELGTYGHRVLNVHIKDRILGGATVPLGTGDADFDAVFEALARLDYSGNFILQTARATDGDHAGLLAQYRDFTQAWMVRYGIAGASE